MLRQELSSRRYAVTPAVLACPFWIWRARMEGKVMSFEQWVQNSVVPENPLRWQQKSLCPQFTQRNVSSLDLAERNIVLGHSGFGHIPTPSAFGMVDGLSGVLQYTQQTTSPILFRTSFTVFSSGMLSPNQ